MRRLRLYLLLSAFAAISVTAADWTRFRGPNGDGTASDPIPLKWTKKDNVRWAQELPGSGNSSPIIVKGKLFLQTASGDGSKRALVCLDAATGKPVWERAFGGQPAKVHQKSSLASCTPTSDGTLIYCAVWDGKAVAVHAVDFAGEPKWVAKLGSFESQHGAGLSPIVHDGKVYVNFDQDGGAEVVALDAKTGEKAWSQSRKAYRACYSTPVLREPSPGKFEVVVFSTAGAAGYDAKTGAINWNWTIPWKDGEMALRSVASPLLAGDSVVCLTGDGSGSRYCAGITINGTEVSVDWEKRSSKLAPYVPCPVVKDGHIYWVTDQGVAECLELKTGKIKWSERATNSAVSASPVLVGDKFVIVDERGKAVVLKANPTAFEKVGDGDIGEAVFASPAVADGKLYIRGAKHLFCIQGKGA
jgi:outer membrane protein assembly factor BamB